MEKNLNITQIDKSKCLLIAEIGVNHNGDMAIAEDLIKLSKKNGAHIAKFQNFRAESLVTNNAPKAKYQKKFNTDDTNQINMLKALELSNEQTRYLKDLCDRYHIEFLSTAFDEVSLKFLIEEIGILRIKIPSGEITNKPFLEYIANQQLPIILSTGMADIKEVNAAIDILTSKNITKESITVLHCTTEYPAPINEINLRAMQTLHEITSCDVGYSDHSLGYIVPLAAYALGASVIEKHITLSRNMEGPDHAASFLPSEFGELNQKLCELETLLGSSTKEPSRSEKKNIVAARKSIVAACNIEKGEIFSNDNLSIKRPGNGISPMKINSVIGKPASKDFSKEDLIEIKL